MNESSVILNAQKINKNNTSGSGEIINIINQLDLLIKQSETHAITGHSGSGKTTLLSLLAGLDNIDSGEITVGNYELSKMNENQLAEFRASMIGIVFQQFYLMGHLSAVENVMLPLEILRKPNAYDKAVSLLRQVNLENRQNHLPSELSGGEIQRVAIARSLVCEPIILFADEPTGNLDTKNGTMISELLFDLVKKQNMTLVLVTHNLELANRCEYIWELNQGKLLNKK
jgi:putative ABC transport system ATP-binding protein